MSYNLVKLLEQQVEDGHWVKDLRLESTFLSWAQGVYETSFPPEERRPWPTLWESEATLVVMGHRDRPCLFASVYPLSHDHKGPTWAEGPETLVEYVAVDALMRGQGWGGRFMRGLQAASGSVLLEIEHPCDETTLARQRFYERLGFVIHTAHYQMPVFSKAGRLTPEKLPMLLMRWPCRIEGLKGQRLGHRVWACLYPQALEEGQEGAQDEGRETATREG